MNTQQGILNRPQGHLHLLALRFRSQEPAACRSAVEALRELIHHELTSDIAEVTKDSPRDLSTLDTGELGVADHYYRSFLTITLGVASSGFERLGVALDQLPQDLTPIPWELFADSPQNADSGDLLLQVCSDNVYVNEHVGRRIEHELADAFEVAWALPGSQRYTTTAGRTSRSEGRALIGFLDGVSNLDPSASI